MTTVTPHQSKALNVEKSISLTANAGSGKTFVLAQRYLQILLNTSAPLNKVAAITFTEKAAGELYKRISVELDKLILTSLDFEAKEKAEKIRKQLVSAKISTIHSFCIDLLREFPVEASLDANFSTINEQKANELIDLTIESAFKELLKDSERSKDIKRLVRLLGSQARLASELSHMIKRRKNVIDLINKFYSGGIDKIAKFLSNTFKRSAKILFENEVPEFLEHLNKINLTVLNHNSKNESANEIHSALKKIKQADELILTLTKINELSNKIVTGNGNVRTRGYLPANLRSEVEDSINFVEEFLNQLTKIELSIKQHEIEKELAAYILSLINVFKYVLSNYESKKSELSVLDFEDILLITKTLLRNENVKESLSLKFSYLLIDEYQDTNEIQYEIFLPLVDELKSGNLFIVGDEKQSIYRFRDAELNVFAKTKEDISLINGQESLLTLPDSFRMAPAICFFINNLFKKLFSEPRLYFNEVPASDLVCARDDDFKGQVEILISSGEEDSEADMVAKKIVMLKEKNSDRIRNWNDIAILVRKRASFNELQKALTKYQIPFNLIGGTGFYQKQTISDIYNYFAFLLNDNDDAALIGTLRSPFFMVSDAQIFELSLFDGETYWQKINNSAGENEFWKKIFTVLNENKYQVHRVSIPLLLRKILRESEIVAVISSRVNGSQEISNLKKLISKTNDFFKDEFNTLYDYVTYLRNSISSTEDESQGKIEPVSPGVNILTIHQAKGLEYPAVFLFKCNDTTQTNKVKSKSFTVDKEFGILTNVPINENYFGDYSSSPIVGIYNLVEEKKELAELKRLLYVALTRAKDFIFISFTDGEKKISKNSFAELIADGLNLVFPVDNIKLSGELTFLQNKNGYFINDVKKIKLDVPVTSRFEIPELNIQSKEVDLTITKLFLSELVDQSNGEVLSATRFSTFITCPLKYNLLYNYKMSGLIEKANRFTKSIRKKSFEEFNRNELESHLLDDHQRLGEYSQLMGSIIHSALRKFENKEELIPFVKTRLKNSVLGEIPENLLTDILLDLNQFYDSNEFKYINSFPEYRNEFEVYLKENDFYLFGILDKIIFDEKKIIIVDYKTDNIDDNQLNSRAEKYLPQLKFYAYIVARLFNKSREIEGRIIFTKYPNKPYIFKYDESVNKYISAGVNDMIVSIRNNDFSPNLKACSECIFTDQNSQCIIDNK